MIPLDDPHYPWYDRDGNRVPLDEWARMMSNPADAVVQQQCVTDQAGRHYEISTVFLGVNANILNPEPPMLFETLAFEIDHEGARLGVAELNGNSILLRYPDEATARHGHDLTVQLVQSINPPHQETP